MKEDHNMVLNWFLKNVFIKNITFINELVYILFSVISLMLCCKMHLSSICFYKNLSCICCFDIKLRLNWHVNIMKLSTLLNSLTRYYFVSITRDLTNANIKLVNAPSEFLKVEFFYFFIIDWWLTRLAQKSRQRL